MGVDGRGRGGLSGTKNDARDGEMPKAHLQAQVSRDADDDGSVTGLNPVLGVLNDGYAM